MTIPSRTPGGRAHLPARDPRNDSNWLVNKAARRILRKRYVDLNAVAGLESDWNLHYPKSMFANHFDHIVDEDTGKLRPCTRAEGNRAPATIPDEDMVRYRKDVRRGRRRKWERPYTVEERQRQCKRRFLKACWELKSRTYATRPELAVRLVQATRRAGGTAYFMTLVTMWGFGRKLRNIKQAGGPTALLGHRARLTATRAAELAAHRNFIDVQWGAFAGGRRMGPRTPARKAA